MSDKFEKTLDMLQGIADETKRNVNNSSGDGSGAVKVGGLLGGITVGTAICPGVGTIIGGLVGWFASKAATENL